MPKLATKANNKTGDRDFHCLQTPQIRVLIEFMTGQCSFRYRKGRIDVYYENTPCSRCLDEEEKVSHVIFDCEAALWGFQFL